MASRNAQKHVAPGGLESRTCQRHGEPLNIFCRSDLEVICLECLKTEHKAHAAVLLEEEYQRAHGELRQIRNDVVVMIEARRNRVHQLQQFMHRTNGYAAKDKASTVKVFQALASAIQSHCNALVEEIEERRRAAQEQAQRSADQLEANIAALQGRVAKMERSLNAKEHHRLLKMFQALCGVPELLALNEVQIPPAPQCLMAVRTAIAGLEETLHYKMEAVPRARLAWARQRFARRVTLDPDTVSTAALVLSEGGKQVQVRRSMMSSLLTDDMFVLARDYVCSSKLYYEVQVSGNTDWMLGAVDQSFKRNRKQQVASWSLRLDKNGNYWSSRTKRPPAAAVTTTTPLFPRTRPKRIGVLVDYTRHEVCFYDVDGKALLHCFTQCEFMEPLYPRLWCNCDNAPLVILGGSDKWQACQFEPGLHQS